MIRSFIHPFLFLALSSAFCFDGWAQPWSIGIQVGPNIASARIESNMEHTMESKTFLSLGLSIRYDFSEQLSVRLEPAYIGRGAQLTVADDPFPFPQDMKYHHIIEMDCFEIPLLVQYCILSDTFEPFIFAGPSISIINEITDSWQLLPSNGQLTGQPIVTDLDEYAASNDVAIELGAGVEYRLDDRIGVSGIVRYSLGLVNLVKKGFYGIDGAWKTSDVRLLAGFRYSL